MCTTYSRGSGKCNSTVLQNYSASFPTKLKIKSLFIPLDAECTAISCRYKFTGAFRQQFPTRHDTNRMLEMNSKVSLAASLSFCYRHDYVYVYRRTLQFNLTDTRVYACFRWAIVRSDSGRLLRW